MQNISSEIQNNSMIKCAIELMVQNPSLTVEKALLKAKEQYEKFFDKITNRLESDKHFQDSHAMDMLAEKVYNKILK